MSGCNLYTYTSNVLPYLRIFNKPFLHWPRLLNNAVNNNSDSDIKQQLHWPPWAM